MAGFVIPKTYLVGATGININGLGNYLQDTGNLSFMNTIEEARQEHTHDGEILCSVAAKVCYQSVTLGHNVNVTKVRDIPDNIRACVKSGHSSVFGHCVVNFITTNCSRILTHEMIRHEVGTDIEVPPMENGLHEWSQTSGRYVRLENIKLAFDPILGDCQDLAREFLEDTEDFVYMMECRKGLRRPPDGLTGVEAGSCFKSDQELRKEWSTHYKGLVGLHPDIDEIRKMFRWVPNNDLNFDVKKKITSAIRRFVLNGQVNEIFWSANLRALRHIIMCRTNRHAEWEIRTVFAQVFELLREKFPIVFEDARTDVVDGILEVTGMKTQPYQHLPQTPAGSSS